MTNLFPILIAVCILLVIIGIILGFVPNSNNIVGDLPVGLFLAGAVGGFAIYLCKKYNIVKFD